MKMLNNWFSLKAWLWLFALANLVPNAGVSAEGHRSAFSANLIVRQDGGAAAPAGRLLAAADKVRIETPELPDGFFLIDAAQPTAYFVRPGMRLYMEARQSSRLTRLFVPVDPDDPCRRWQAMAQLAGLSGREQWHCERVGEETVGGRGVIVYRAFSGADEQFVAWVDPLLRFPVQIRIRDGALIALDAVREEAQPMQLVEMPAGFRKFDPAMLVKQIKQSDVWVEPR